MATTNALLGQVLGGRYRLRALLGAGASAQVFVADDLTLRRKVAVKVLHASLAHDETFLRRFRKEAQAAAALNHPNVLAVYDWGQDDLPYIVTEYLAGGSLRAMLDAGHRLSCSQALLVGLEVARGLEYAHRRGLVHRDIKPANLLFDEERRLRIADFGLARALAEAGLTEPSGAILGTARYASPEQAKGEPLTGKTDVYSLALVLVECVTGEVPFAAETTLGSLLARVDQPMSVPAALGPLRPALERAGDPDPAHRPDAEELAIALMAAAEDLRRPEPLPIVGAMAIDPDAPPLDPTMVHALAHDELIVGPADATATLVASPAPDPTAVQEAPPPVAAPPTAVRLDDEEDGPRRRWPWVLLGVLLIAGAVSGGVVAYLRNRTITHVMPANLSGQDVSVLQDLARKNHWVLDAPREDRSDEVAAGRIIDVTPPAGTKVAEGATVGYTVSLGRKPVPIPKLDGMTLDQARAELDKAQLTLGTPVRANSETVDKDKIIGVDTVGAEAPPGTAIVVRVSDGPAARTVPDVTNKVEADATKALTDLKLTVARAEEFSDTVPQGSVIRTDPVAGTQVPRDSSVNLVVSKGPEPRKVPNVFGMTVIQAAATLRAAGFDIGDTKGPADKTVIATDPPTGELRPPGTKINIITRTT